MQTKKVFIVDDDPFWNHILVQILEDLGFSDIHSYGDGESCVDHLSMDPEIIFLDMEMQGMDGLDVLDAIKAYNKDIDVVFCTSKEDISIAVSALNKGSFDFLLKSNGNRKNVMELISQMN